MPYKTADSIPSFLPAEKPDEKFLGEPRRTSVDSVRCENRSCIPKTKAGAQIELNVSFEGEDVCPTGERKESRGSDTSRECKALGGRVLSAGVLH